MITDKIDKIVLYTIWQFLKFIQEMSHLRKRWICCDCGMKDVVKMKRVLNAYIWFLQNFGNLRLIAREDLGDVAARFAHNLATPLELAVALADNLFFSK